MAKRQAAKNDQETPTEKIQPKADASYDEGSIGGDSNLGTNLGAIVSGTVHIVSQKKADLTIDLPKFFQALYDYRQSPRAIEHAFSAGVISAKLKRDDS